MRVYKCRLCGQPKAGHVCTGIPNSAPMSSSVHSSALPPATTIDQPETKRRRTRLYDDDDSEEEDGEKTPVEAVPVDIQAFLAPHIEQMKTQILSSLQPVMTSAMSSCSAKPPACPGAYIELMDEIKSQYETFKKTAEQKRDMDMKALDDKYQRDLANHGKKKDTNKLVTFAEFLSDPSAGTWSEIFDQNVVSMLTALQAETDCTKFTIAYATNGHKYECVKQPNGKMIQTNLHYSTQREVRTNTRTENAGPKKKQPQPPQPLPSWQKNVYFDSWPVTLSRDFYENMLKKYDFGLTDDVIDGKVECVSKELADLATMFDSMGLQTQFSKSLSEIWNNPPAFANFLRMALNRQYFQLRLVVHGSGSYDTMRSDAYVFDQSRLTANRVGHGIYVACSPHIAYDYRVYKGHGVNDKNILLGILLKHPQDNNLVYQQYHLGTQHYNEDLGQNGQDAFCVRESSMLFWFGLAKDV